MSQVPVIAIQNPGQLPAALLEERNRHLENLHAAECLWATLPHNGMKEDGRRLRIITHRRPGASENLHVVAFPREIFVEGGTPEDCERFPLVLEINPESVRASLVNDLLTITAKAHRQGA